MYAPGDLVRYRGRLFVVAVISSDGTKATLRDDEGGHITVRTSQIRPD